MDVNHAELMEEVAGRQSMKRVHGEAPLTAKLVRLVFDKVAGRFVAAVKLTTAGTGFRWSMTGRFSSYG